MGTTDGAWGPSWTTGSSSTVATGTTWVSGTGNTEILTWDDIRSADNENPEPVKLGREANVDDLLKFYGVE